MNIRKCYIINNFILVPRSEKSSYSKLVDSKAEPYEEYGDPTKSSINNDFGRSTQNLNTGKFDYQLITNF